MEVGRHLEKELFHDVIESFFLFYWWVILPYMTAASLQFWSLKPAGWWRLMSANCNHIFLTICIWQHMLLQDISQLRGFDIFYYTIPLVEFG